MNSENVPSATCNPVETDATEFLFRRYLAAPAPRYQYVTNALTAKKGILCAGCHRISWRDMDVKERHCSCLGISHDLVSDIEAEGRAILGDKDHGP
jgi:hypothetical protein